MWSVAEPSELQLCRAELLPDKQMMTHLGSSRSLFNQNSEEQSRDRFLCCQLKWLCAACCSVNQPHGYSLKPFLCGASSGFKKAKIIHLFSALRQKPNSVTGCQHSHPSSALTADVIFPMVHPDGSINARGFLTFPLGAGRVYLRCFN